MPPILDGTASEYGAPDPSRMDRIVHALSEVSAKLWGLFAASLICGAAVLVEVWL